MRAAEFLSDPMLADTHWSIAIREIGGDTLLEVGRRRQLSTASVAKVFLLIEVAAQLESGALDARERLSADAVDPVGDSGLWQHLDQRSLPLTDVAALVGAVSDNLATNVLLDRVGLDVVQARAATLAPFGSTLHDRVRDVRGSLDPPTLSTGTADDWARIVTDLELGAACGDPVNTRVARWLGASVDHSLVLSGLGRDPLVASASATTAGLRGVVNKTGADLGVRADVGVVRGAKRSVAYAVICNWNARRQSSTESVVVETMRELGRAIAQHVSSRGARSRPTAETPDR